MLNAEEFENYSNRLNTLKDLFNVKIDIDEDGLTYDEIIEKKLLIIEDKAGFDYSDTVNYTFEERLTELETYAENINAKFKGNISSVVYKTKDSDGNVTDTERFNFVDAGAVNRLRAYVDSYIKDEILNSIETDIDNLKTFVGYNTDTNLSTQINTLTQEIYDQSSSTDASRLDTAEENLNLIAGVLQNDANIDVELKDAGDNRLETIEENIKIILNILKSYGYENIHGTCFKIPENADYISSDSNGKIQANTAADSVEKRNYKLVTSDAVAYATEDCITEGDCVNLGTTESKDKLLSWSTALFSNLKYYLSNDTAWFNEFYVDATGTNASFTSNMNDGSTEWPLIFGPNTIMYIPVVANGKIIINSYSGNFKIFSRTGKYLNFIHVKDDEYSCEFEKDDTIFLEENNERYIKIYSTAKDYIKSIDYSYTKDWCLKIKNDKIIATVPVVSEDGEELISSRTLSKISKNTIGLSNVNNTSDINKPVSIYQQKALDELKSELKSELKMYKHIISLYVSKFSEKPICVFNIYSTSSETYSKIKDLPKLTEVNSAMFEKDGAIYIGQDVSNISGSLLGSYLYSNNLIFSTFDFTFTDENTKIADSVFEV